MWLFNLWMKEQHLNEINIITTLLSLVRIKFDEDVRVLMLLSSL